MNITHKEWVERYTKMHAIAERIDHARMQRARQAAREAGLDPSIIGIHVHNALVSRHAGQPWPGIDYSKVRLANRLMTQATEPYRIIRRWDARVRGV